MIIANEERLQKISRIIDAIVFAATTLAIAGVFYEGMTLKWYGPVGIFVVCMDYTFLVPMALSPYKVSSERVVDAIGTTRKCR